MERFFTNTYVQIVFVILQIIGIIWTISIIENGSGDLITLDWIALVLLLFGLPVFLGDLIRKWILFNRNKN